MVVDLDCRFVWFGLTYYWISYWAFDLFIWTYFWLISVFHLLVLGFGLLDCYLVWFGPIILVRFGLIYLLNLVLGLIKIFSMGDPCLYFFMFWHCVESRKSKIRAVGVVEAGYGHEQKVGGTWFEIKGSLAVWSRGAGDGGWLYIGLYSFCIFCEFLLRGLRRFKAFLSFVWEALKSD